MSARSVYIGIDLGSTTTKAVLLGENGESLGRGITNTRSSYDVAATAVRDEAFVQVRFGLLRQALATDPRLAAIQAPFLAALTRHFRMQ